MKHLNLNKLLLEEIGNALDKKVPPILMRYDLILNKVPSLKRGVELILTKSFRYFVKDVLILSPKPTTFRVVLNNGFTFQMIYQGKGNYLAKISGKKYHLDVTTGVNQASQAVSDLLAMGTKPLPATENIDNVENTDSSFSTSDGGGNMSSGGENLPTFEPIDNQNDNEPDIPEEEFASLEKDEN